MAPAGFGATRADGVGRALGRMTFAPVELWAAVESYIVDRLVPQSAELQQSLIASGEAGLPAVEITPNLGKLFHLLARIRDARRILEIGTLGGYSTIWLAGALPEDGELISIEAKPERAEVARENIARAGLDGVAEVRLGAALDVLPEIAAEDDTRFDLIFIDADKRHASDYLDWALRLARSGSLILVDNAVRAAQILEDDSDDEGVRGMRRVFDMVGLDPRLSATALQTVDSKGYDGFILILVGDED